MRVIPLGGPVPAFRQENVVVFRRPGDAGIGHG
ncbi:hypothetical protein FHR84_000111 [Actinopolyspora biskrensis]|uniref:Uncharacterized protein n=1 Tax=Actinopolyspora biskrensis TaxID=1470178 RepID=A0A852Z3B5_9ACTN|nr:hypothetical protein [Actinopolyspora biskrensis]